MTWRYIAAKKTDPLVGEYWEVHEFYEPDSWTLTPICPTGSTRKELVEELRRMLADVEVGGYLDYDAEKIVEGAT